MKYNVLGNTGLVVSELCFGTMTFGGQGYWEAVGKQTQDEANELIKQALDAGINFIDTANIYSYGQSEKLLGQSLKQLEISRNEIVLATKVRGRMSESPNNTGLSRYHIFQSVDDSLQRLQVDHIDILYVHGYDPLTPVEEIMRSLNDVVNTGKVRYIAVCNWPAWLVMKGLGIAEKNGWHKFIGLQYYYSLAGRDAERDIFPLAKDQNLGVMPWSPLAGGFLSGKYSREKEKAGNSRRDDFDFPPVDKEKAFDIIEVQKVIGEKHGVSPAEVALAWVRSNPLVTSTIIGAKNSGQLKSNLKSVDIDFTDEDVQKLEEISALPKEYPGWMVERQSQDRALNQQES